MSLLPSQLPPPSLLEDEVKKEEDATTFLVNSIGSLVLIVTSVAQYRIPSGMVRSEVLLILAGMLLGVRQALQPFLSRADVSPHAEKALSRASQLLLVIVAASVGTLLSPIFSALEVGSLNTIISLGVVIVLSVREPLYADRDVLPLGDFFLAAKRAGQGD